VLKIDCRALLFDMDGVLIDSTAAVARVWKRWASERGFDPETVAAMAQGRPSITTIRDLLPNADHLAENREVERREMEDLNGVIACPGALQMLSRLPADLWALVTSSTKPLAEVRLRAAGLPIPKLLVTGSDVVNGKPHPEPFLKGAALVGFPPDQCIVVEDTPAGIRAGKLAGARVLAFRTTMSDSELRAAGPDWLVDDCSSLSVVSASFERGIELELSLALQK
jgi:sugar-phosphatase